MEKNPGRKWFSGSRCLGGAAFTLLLMACGGGGGGSSSAPVPTAPAITTQPANQTVTVGATATFTAAASGNPAPTYQWYVGSTAIPNATSTSYTTPAATLAMNGNMYTVIATNSMGSVTSNGAYLTVNNTNTAPTITTQPVNQTVTVGATATFTAAASGNPAPTYQWYVGSTAIPNATSASYTTPAATLAMNGNMYSVIATNSLGSATSNAAYLTVNTTATAPVFTTQPANQTVQVGATATFTAVATGNPAPTYQWYQGVTAIFNATSASYTTPATTLSMNNNSYTVVATNSMGSVTSNPAVLTVNPVASGMDNIYCGTITLSGSATPMIAAVTATGEFRFAITNDWVGSATLSGSTGSGTLYTARGATPNTLSLSSVVVTPGSSITGSYAYGSATGTFSLIVATDPKTGVVLYNNPTMVLPVTGYTTATVDNAGWQSSAYPWTGVNVDASGNITMTVNNATVTGTLTQLSSGVNLYRINLTFATSGAFTGLGWWSGDSYSGPAGGYGWPLTLGGSLGDGFFADVFYCILSTTPGNSSNLGVAASVTYPQ